MITDPQHWAVRLEEYIEYADSDGNVVDEDQWIGTPKVTPKPSLPKACATPTTLSSATAFTPELVLPDPEAAGLQVSDMYQRNAEWSARDRSGESHPVTTDLDSDASEDDRGAARLRAEAEQAEAKKRERRIVVTLNKFGAAASGVRRAWVATLLSALSSW